MVQLEFRENIKMLMVLTDNIFDFVIMFDVTICCY